MVTNIWLACSPRQRIVYALDLRPIGFGGSAALVIPILFTRVTEAILAVVAKAMGFFIAPHVDH